MHFSRFDEHQPMSQLVPAITVAAFCEDPRSLQAVTAAAADRRMIRAFVTAAEGGIPAAIEAYRELKTPNVLIIETAKQAHEILPELASLAPVCDPDTHVIVVGRVNDVLLYRALIQNGIAEYMVAPLDPLRLIDVIGSLFGDHAKKPAGRLISFLPAKGGAGSSTIAQHVGWLISKSLDMPAVIADFDIHFGTAALNFNADAATGVADALADPGRLDQAFLERLMTRVNERLMLLAGTAALERDFLPGQEAVEQLLTALRDVSPWVVADLPGVWNPVSRHLIMLSDEIVITVTPELAALRNAKAIVDHLVSLRPNDTPPRLVINMTGADKRLEIPPQDMAKALHLEVTAVVPYDPAGFGQAVSKGQMITAAVPGSPAVAPLQQLARSIAGKRQPAATANAAASPASILERVKALLKR